MNLRRVLFAAVAWPVLVAGAARAAEGDRPLTLPSRDVDVTYQMSRPDGGGGQQTMSQRMRWAAAPAMLRVDPPSAGMYMIMDYRAHRLWAVRDGERSVLEIDTGEGVAPGLAHATAFTRDQDIEVAGLPCTEWDTRDTGGAAATVCLTTDGVLLRARRGTQVMVEAARVTYGTMSPEVFRVPPDYRRVVAPAPGTPAR